MMTAQPVPELRLLWDSGWVGTGLGQRQWNALGLRQAWLLCGVCRGLLSPLWGQCDPACALSLFQSTYGSKSQPPNEEVFREKKTGTIHKNTGFAVFSLDGLVFPLCLFHVQVLLSHIFARWGEESGVSMGVESQCMGLENTNVVFLPLQISNVDSADKSRKEVSREKINRRM